MDKMRERGIYGGIGTGAFGVIMAIVAANTGFSNLTGEVEGAIGIIFILISIAAFARPMSMGQIAMRILENQQKALFPDRSIPQNTQSNHSENVGGDVINVQGTHNTVVTNPRNTPENNRVENQRILGLFESEISRIEINLNSVPDITDNSGMIRYAVELWKQGNPQTFESTPIYSQYLREMTQFGVEFQRKLIEFYDVVQVIHRNEDFELQPGTNYKYFQIKAYFDNVRKARSLIPEIKDLIERERSQ